MKIPPIGYETAYEVRTHDVDNQKKMTIPSIVKLMQEAAMQNAIQLRFSIWDFEGLDFNWVLMRKQLKVNRAPLMGEKVSVGTYPSGFQRFFAYRDYCIFDKNGEILASSASTWLLMDLNERKVVPIPDFILSIEKDCPPKEECLPRPKGRLKRFGSVEQQVQFQVNWHDLDFNEHLNNVHYIQWMLEALPKSVLDSGALQSFDIHYKAECHWQAQLEAQTSILEEGHYQHRLINLETEEEVARADSNWQIG